MGGPVETAVQRYVVHPVAIDLRHQVAAVGRGEGAVGAAELLRRAVTADPGRANDLARPVQPQRWWREQEQAAVLDIRADQAPAGQHHRVVWVGHVIGGAPGHARSPVPVNDGVTGDADNADNGVFLLGRDDVPAVRREERIVWQLERLARREVAGPGELPPDAPTGID